MEIVARDPGPFRFNPTARQTPPFRHRAAPDPARRRGRPARRDGSTGSSSPPTTRGSPTPSRAFGGEAVMTRADHPSGTDRVAEVAAALARRRGSSSTSRATSPRSPARRSTWSSRSSRTTPTPRWRPSPRRSATSRSTATRRASRSSARAAGRALYFSRSPIPCHRDGLPDRRRGRSAYLHLGLYAYRRDFLLEPRHAAPLAAGDGREARTAPRPRGGLPDRRRDRRRAERRDRHARGLPPVRRRGGNAGK